MAQNEAAPFEIQHPPQDVELGFERKPLQYLAAFPSSGVGPDTGIILFIGPFGMRPEHDYCKNVLLPRLAEQYDCVAAAAAYFGIGTKSAPNATLMPPAGLDIGIRNLLGDAVAGLSLIDQLGALAKAGLNQLPTELAFHINPFPEYQSFGFMPALDNIGLLAELMHRYPVRRDRLYCLGSSYGGYIASMMLKMAPNTFHAIIENSGFISAKPDEMNNIEFKGYNWVTLNGLRVPIYHLSPWTFTDETSARFVTQAHKDMRNCAIDDHYAVSPTFFRSYHSSADKLVPIDDKRHFWTMIGRKTALRHVEVTESMIDGKLFKTLDHGLDVSLLELTADALKDVPFAAQSAATDFDLETNRALVAGDRIYRLQFGKNLDFQVTIEKH